MHPYVTLAGCLFLIVALFVQDRHWRLRQSIATWIPLTWVLLQGSRPLSTLFARSGVNSLQAVYEGSPLDRNVYLVLIVSGLLILISRRVNWSRLAATNKWLIAFFLYLCVSVLWSDYTFIAFKRWIKDFGNVIMVLVILTEAHPASAAKALFIRAGYVLLPLSFVVAKYFPEISRYYDEYGRAFDSALAADKNMLGMTLTVLALALIWGLFDAGNEKSNGRRKLEIGAYILLLLLAIALLRTANSATAVVCITIGVGLMAALRWRFVRSNIRFWTTLVAACAVLFSVPGVRAALLEPIFTLLGRDLSLTGRDVVWEILLEQDVNPIVGTGAYSFWMGERIEVGIPGIPGTNEAHNAYLEIYLNVGLIGLALYLAMLTSCAWSTMRRLVAGEMGHEDRFRLMFILVAIIYGVTEAVVRQNLIWLGLLLMIMSRPAPSESLVSPRVQRRARTVRPTAVTAPTRNPLTGAASQRVGGTGMSKPVVNRPSQK